MNEKNITDLLGLLTTMANEIKALKAWKSELDSKNKAEEEAQAASQAEFEKFINQRRAEEAKRAADAEELKKLMI